MQTPAPLLKLNLYATGVTSPQGVELANNGVDFISVPTGTTRYCCVKPGASYDITVFAQPTNPRETCIVTDGSGVMGTSGVVTVAVTCNVDTGRFVYVNSRGSNSLAAFAIDSVTGALTPVAGSPIPTGQSPVAIAVDPWTQYAFVANQADGTLSAFRIDAATGYRNAGPPQSKLKAPRGRSSLARWAIEQPDRPLGAVRIMVTRRSVTGRAPFRRCSGLPASGAGLPRIPRDETVAASVPFTVAPGIRRTRCQTSSVSPIIAK